MMKTHKFSLNKAILSVFAMLVLAPASALAKTERLSFLQIFWPINFTVEAQGEVEIAEEISEKDAEKRHRAGRIDAYYKKRNMPLEGYGMKFVEVAEKCDIDWRLLPAIGVRESSGGKNAYNNNPFGWGSAKIRFSDYNEAIEKVSDNLCGLNPNTARYYKDKTTEQRLWYYNGTVIRSYPKEVVQIMNMF